MEKKKELNSGILRTLGELVGELQDISKWKEEKICVLLVNAIHTLSLTSSKISNWAILKLNDLKT